MVWAWVTEEVWALAGALDLEEELVLLEVSAVAWAAVSAGDGSAADGAAGTRTLTAAPLRGCRGAGGPAQTQDITGRRIRGTACCTATHTETGDGKRFTKSVHGGR